MRFLSDDGKVFNTLDECKSHEAEVKKKSIEEKEKEKEFRKLTSRADSIVEDINQWTEDFDKFENKYGTNDKIFIKYGKDFNSFLEILKELL